MSQKYYIYLKCIDGSGYFTGILQNSNGQEVGVHPYKEKAYRFNDWNTALTTAKKLKMSFSCIMYYEVTK